MRRTLFLMSIFAIFVVLVGCNNTTYEESNITQVELGTNHSARISFDGKIFTWGANEFGQLGDGTTTDRHAPIEITSEFELSEDEIVTSLSLGHGHSSAITSYGRVFTWGYNNWGQLGDGTTTDRHTPTEITSQFELVESEVITNISLGYTHSSAITSEGRVFTWGMNLDGQLGDDTRTDKSVPIEITTQFDLTEDETITSLSLGRNSSSAITSEGRVFTWGSDFYAQLGNGMTTDRHEVITTPTEITSNFDLAKNEDVISLSLGWSHSSAITSEGRVYTWGSNSSGQLGDGETTDRHVPTEITSQFDLREGETITQLSLGASHSSAITSEGRVFTWGYNKFGQLGYGMTSSYDPNPTPIEITSQFDLADGEVIKSLSLGGAYSSAITTENHIFTWGANESGQLGDGTTTDRHVPTETIS